MSPSAHYPKKKEIGPKPSKKHRGDQRGLPENLVPSIDNHNEHPLQNSWLREFKTEHSSCPRESPTLPNCVHKYIDPKGMVSMVMVATIIPNQSRKAYQRWKFYYINLILIQLPGKTLLSIHPSIPPYRHQYYHYFSFSTLPQKNEEVRPKPSKKHRGNRRGLTWKPKPQCWQSPMYNLFQNRW